MTKKNALSIVEQKIEALRKKRESIFKMDPEKAMEEILDFNESYALVHSFPEQSLYMLMHEAGHEDFLPILSMATKKQWEYIVDLEIWEKDQINIFNASYWLGILHMADPGRLAQWLLDDQEDFLTYFLRNRIDVVLREHDEDPSIIPDDYITFDDVIYFKVLESGEDKNLPIEIKSLVNDILARIADISYRDFQTIIFISAGVINAEHQEHLFRFRNARLEEKGLIPAHEAIEILAPINLKNIKKRPADKNLVPDIFVDEKGNINSSQLIDAFSVNNYLLDSDDFSLEFVSLCNQIISAEHKKIRTREELLSLVKRVSGILKTGAEYLGKSYEKEDKRKLMEKAFGSYYTLDIFKAGNTLVRNLREKVLKWQKNSFIIKNSFNLSFLGEKWFGITGGLIAWPAVYFDNYENSSGIYKEFSSLEEITKTEKELEKLFAVDDLLALMGVKEIKTDDLFINWKNFILTLWARDWLHLDENIFEPIEINKFKKFYDWLWIEDNGIKTPGKEKKQDFLNWIVRTADLKPEFILERLGPVFDELFELVEEELGSVGIKNIDPKYISLFVLK
ncbi:MAG: DUF6178 family protein [Desulforegulaceae bacterium]|jgi:hypothetical protein|nr:DUF6178 family protein [Desulforegulaceae bacterium]